VDIVEYNRQAWDNQVQNGNQWTQPVTRQQVIAARLGHWQIVLTPTRPVPRNWFGELSGCSVLCLAGGGGQQGPLLAAAGAKVTVFDNSPAQLGQDELVARRDGLDITTVCGDMQRLDCLADNSYDLIVHPCSNGFIPNVIPVWNESFRVLRPGGRLMTGFTNPLYYLFDYSAMKKGKLRVKYSIPYADERDMSHEDLQQLIDDGEPLEFGHTLTDQLGGQTDAGFRLIGFYEDGWPEGPTAQLSKYIQCFVATLAEKPA
jgi:SAM-dependent methyltransferase